MGAEGLNGTDSGTVEWQLSQAKRTVTVSNGSLVAKIQSMCNLEQPFSCVPKFVGAVGEDAVWFGA